MRSGAFRERRRKAVLFQKLDGALASGKDRVVRAGAEPNGPEALFQRRIIKRREGRPRRCPAAMTRDRRAIR